MSLYFGLNQAGGIVVTSTDYKTPGTFLNVDIPTGCIQIDIECYGGGGSGGGIRANGLAGGGGGGAYAKYSVINPPTLSRLNIYVGATKTGSTLDGATGNDSYVTYDDGDLVNEVCRAKAGSGGLLAGSGGAGGLASASTGSVKRNGGSGSSGMANYNSGAGGGGAGSTSAGEAGNSTTGIGGAGGGGLAGKGGNGVNFDLVPGSNGIGGTQAGGGGGGAQRVSGTTYYAGGTGAAGAVKITYTVSS